MAAGFSRRCRRCDGRASLMKLSRSSLSHRWMDDANAWPRPSPAGSTQDATTSVNYQNFHHGFAEVESRGGGGTSSLGDQKFHQGLASAVKYFPLGKVSLSTRCASSRNCVKPSWS